MKQSYFTGMSGLFLGSGIVRKYTFKAMHTRGSHALLAVSNRQLAHGAAMPGDESALFQKYDCFECLSPHVIAA